MSVWSGVLDSCPGLLCCVVNIKGRLMYATHGYRAIAARLFGHKCEEGSNYPPLITEIDRAIHEALTAACLGETNSIEMAEHDNIWELSASPLRIDGETISGVVIRITSSAKPVQEAPPVVMTNPEILNSVPFRACVADTEGVILAANKFLASSLGKNPTGTNIAALVGESEALTKILADKSGSLEAEIDSFVGYENFYGFTPEEIYLDEELNEIHEAKPQESRIIHLHAGPAEWDKKPAVMLTFEDVTDLTRAHEQLHRLLTYEPDTGILNRRGIEHTILRQFPKAIQDGRNLSLIALRVDDMNTDGYLAMNNIMREFVRSVRRFMNGRAEHSIARWSQNEFMILAECPAAVAVVMANEIRDRARGITVSAGAADLHEGGYSSVNEFIGAAYDAMNRARLEGGNKTILAGR